MNRSLSSAATAVFHPRMREQFCEQMCPKQAHHIVTQGMSLVPQRQFTKQGIIVKAQRSQCVHKLRQD